MSILHTLQRFSSARIDLLAILVASLYPLSWFQPELIYISGDLFLPLSKTPLADVYSAWFRGVDFGYPAFNLPLKVLWQGFFHLLLSIGISIFDAERMYFVTAFLFSGLGMYYLVKTTFDQNHKLTPLLSALLYMYNPYIMISFVFIPMYAAFPWLVAFLIKGMKKGNITNAVVTGLLSSLIFLNFPNPLHPFLALGVAISLCIFHLLSERRKSTVKHVGMVVLITIVISAAVNLWWILPTLKVIPQLYVQGAAGGLGLDEFGKGVTVTLDTLRLMGSWGFHASFENKPYVPYGDVFYKDPIVLIATFSIPLIVFAATYLRKGDKFTIFFSLLGMVFLFLAKGSNPPAGDFYAWALKNLPLFATFRDPYKFMAIVTLSYSVLFGPATNGILDKVKHCVYLKRRKCKAASTLIIGVVLVSLFISAWPMVTGDIISNWYDPPNRGVEIPRYYYDASLFLDQDSGFRTLSLPRKDVYSANSWGYQGTDIIPHIFHQPVVTGQGATYSQLVSFSSEDVIDELYTDIYRQYLAAQNLTTPSNDFDCLAELLGMYGIKYILLDGSVVSGYYPSLPTNASLGAIVNREGLAHKVDFGELQIFQNQLVKPIVHGASDPLILASLPGNGTLFNDEILQTLKTDFADTVIIVENQNEPSLIVALRAVLRNCSVPELDFDQISPHEYRVYVNASTPFILVFTESFDSQWRAYAGGDEMAFHLVANICSNAWLLNKTGQYEIRIEYVQQDLLVTGTIISVLAFVICFTFIIIRTKGQRLSQWFRHLQLKPASEP